MRFFFLSLHPMDLVVFSGLSSSIGKILPATERHLIWLSHPYYTGWDPKIYRQYFSLFDRVTKGPYLAPSLKIQKEVPKFLQLKSIMTSLGWNKTDIIFFSAHGELSSNLGATLAKESGAKTVLIRPPTESPQQLEKDPALFLRLNIYTLLFSLSRMNAFRLPGSSVIKHIEYAKGMPFDHIFELKVPSTTPLPSNAVFFPWLFNPDWKKSAAAEIASGLDFDLRQPMVIYFGNRFRSWTHVDPKLYAQYTNEILQKIRRRYSAAKWIYKCHPLEGADYEDLDLTGFTVVKGNLTAEVIFSLASKVEGVFSFGSTSCLTAFGFGIPAHVWYRSYPLVPNIRHAYDQLFESLPDDIFVNPSSDIKDQTPRLTDFNNEILSGIRGMIEQIK